MENIYEDEQEHGWPGDGSGLDDLADFNANEADDYRDEGGANDGDANDGDANEGDANEGDANEGLE